MKLLSADSVTKKDNFVGLAYEEKWYIGKIEGVDMTVQKV